MGEGLGEAAVRILAALKEVRLEDSKETSEKHLHGYASHDARTEWRWGTEAAGVPSIFPRFTPNLHVIQRVKG